jgi:heat shock protein HslJ
MSLVFDRAPETPPLDSAWLEFTEWRLRRMSWMEGGTVMVRAIDTPLVTLFFARNRFEGQGFCNSYSGDYQGQTTPNEGQLWIKSFTATERACREYPLEARYFAMLAASPTPPLWTRYRVTTETLVLTSERGTLEYVRLR